MGLLAHALRLSELTLGSPPPSPRSSQPSTGDVIPMVPDLIRSSPISKATH
jgi:hypothetical protein